MKAAWRIEELPLSGRSHSVIRFTRHIENQQNVVFEEDKEYDAIRKNNDTTLTAWFKLNQKDKEAYKIKYLNIPKFYFFTQKIRFVLSDKDFLKL